MNDLIYIGIFIFVILIVVAIVLALYLSNYVTHVDDDEQYESDANYSEPTEVKNNINKDI